MNSRGADSRISEHFRVPYANMRNDFSLPDHNTSQYYNVNDLPRNRAVEASRNDFHFCDDEPAGPGHNSGVARQPTKRLRSNFDEASVSRLSQVLAWLPRASSEDVEKIWHFLNVSMVSSSSTSLRANNDSRSVVLPTTGIGIEIGNQEQHLTTQNEMFLPSDPAVPEGFEQYQNWMQPIGPIDDLQMDPTPVPTSKLLQMPSNYEASARMSMPIQSGASHTQLSSRSHVSYPLSCANTPAPVAAALLLRQSGTARRQDVNRESVQSHSSYSSIDTDMGVNSGRSSVTSLESLSSRSSKRLPPQKTMSSSGSSPLKKSHARSSSLGGSAKPSLEISCTYPDCSRTFTRDPDRIRHESSIHSTEVRYTCLLHTCTASCPDSCDNKDHNSPYQNSRADKMKEHLDKIHGWRLKQNEIPKSFMKSYERQQRGWICACGMILGSWHDNEVQINAHSESCTEVLRMSFKRISVEELSKDGDRKVGSPALDKALPRIINSEDEEWVKGFLQEWSQPH